MTSKSDEIVQQVQHEFQTLLADLTGSESTGVVYLGGEDPRCKSVRGRDQARQVIEERLTAWFAAHTVKEAIDTFSHHGIPINAVNDVPTAAHEPQLHERELLVEVPDPIAGRIHVSGKNIKLSRSEVVVGSTPLPGQHTAEIPTSLLHYTPEEIRKLETEGAVYGSPGTAAASS